MLTPYWYAGLNGWSDQTGVAHALKPDGAVAVPLCGTKGRISGGGHRTAEEIGCHECKQCRKALDKLIRAEQRRIILEALADAKKRVLTKLDEGKLPESWDGFELRWLLAQAVDHRVMTNENRKRRREFDNECLVRNLP